jgi:indole-3-glycerol phosphate synthase
MLNQIVARTRADLVERMKQVTLEALNDRFPEALPVSLEAKLQRPGVNVIAEIKYRSPSHGPFKCHLEPEEVAQAYAENGAAALSILTDEPFFGGSLKYLERVYRYLQERDSEEDSDRLIPLLRKDFILDRYQVAEARAYGAAAFLLIAACLEADQCRSLIDYGREISLEALVEIHGPFELDVAVDSGARLLGVNNRNLKTFEVDINTSFEIARRLEGEDQFVLVAESGVSHRSEILELKDAGFQGFLIGTAFMESDDPGTKLRELTHGE